MKKAINFIAIAIFKVDTVLYKTLGIVSPYRREAWDRQSKRLQRDLDREHSMRECLNTINGTNYTTKQALTLKGLSI